MDSARRWHAPTSSSSRSAPPPASAPPTPPSPRRSARGRARRGRRRGATPAGPHVRADRLRVGARGAASRPRGARAGTSRARSCLLDDRRGAAVAAARGDPLRRPRRRQPPRPPRHLAAAGGAAAAARRRRCCVPVARRHPGRDAVAARTGAWSLPIAVEASPDAGAPRDIAAITYAADPWKKGLDRVLAAWSAARRDGEELRRRGDRCGRRRGRRARAPAGSSPAAYRALLRRARVFVTAPRREDYGLAQLEALADGCLLVTTPAPGPYAALPLARELDPRLVGEDLAGALRAALDAPAPATRRRRAAALRAVPAAAVDEVVARGAAAAAAEGGLAHAPTRQPSPACAAPRTPSTAACSRPARRPSHARRAVATAHFTCSRSLGAVGVGVDEDRARPPRPRRARGRR